MQPTMIFFTSIADTYGELCYRGFLNSYPLGTLLVAKDKHWRICSPEARMDDKHDYVTLGIKSDWVNSEEGLGGETYLVLDYFKDNGEYGALCLNVTTNEKFRITSSWCHNMNKQVPG